MILQLAKLILAVPQLFELFLKIQDAVDSARRAAQFDKHSGDIDDWVRDGTKKEKPGS